MRYVFNLQLKRWPTPAERTELYERPDLAASPLLRRASARLYLCRCRVAHQALEANSLLDDSAGPAPDAATQASGIYRDWACAGHPLSTLPRRIDGIEVTLDNVGNVTLHALRGACCPARRREPCQVYGPLPVRTLGKDTAQGAVLATINAALTDPSPEVRGAALNSLSILGLPGLATARCAPKGIAACLRRSLTRHWGRTADTGTQTLAACAAAVCAAW